MKVKADVNFEPIEDENGNRIDGVILTCNRCGHTTQSFGQHEGSIRRCLALLNEECLEGENNFYIADEASE